MTDTLKRLGGPTALTTAAATLYTAPAATTTTITGIHVANEGAAQATFTFSVGTDGAGKRFFYQIPVATAEAFDWSGTLVLAAAEVVQALASAATTLTITVTGVETT
jgi:hypothetical protein